MRRLLHLVALLALLPTALAAAPPPYDRIRLDSWWADLGPCTTHVSYRDGVVSRRTAVPGDLGALAEHRAPPRLALPWRAARTRLSSVPRGRYLDVCRALDLERAMTLGPLPVLSVESAHRVTLSRGGATSSFSLSLSEAGGLGASPQARVVAALGQLVDFDFILRCVEDAAAASVAASSSPSPNFPVARPRRAVRARSPRRFRVVEGGRSGFIDERGRLAVPARYEAAQDFSGGLAAVRLHGLWGYVDPAGALAIAPAFAEARPFAGGLGAVRRPGQAGWTFIDRRGAAAFSVTNRRVQDFASGLAAFEEGGVFGYLDRRGRVALSPRFEAAGPFGGGLAPVRLQGRWGYVDRGGRVVIPATFEQAGAFAGGLARAVLDGRVGFLSLRGAWTVAPVFLDAAPAFRGGLAAVRTADGWGYVDRAGRVVVRPAFAEAGSFSSGLAPVRVPGPRARWGFVDRSGRLAVAARFWSAEPFRDGLARVHDGGLVGYVATDGAWVWGPRAAGL